MSENASTNGGTAPRKGTLADLAAMAPPPETRKVFTRPAVSGPRIGGEGDYTTLDVVRWMSAHGLYGRDMGNGKHAVQCPWTGEHSSDHGAEKSDTVVWPGEPGVRWPSFKCQHAHCEGRGIKDLIGYFGDADQYCARKYDRPGWKAGAAKTAAPQEPPPDLQALFAAIQPAPEAERPTLLRAFARAVAGVNDAITADLWAEKLKISGMLTKGAFLSQVKEEGKAAKKQAKLAAVQERIAAKTGTASATEEEDLPRIDADDQELKQVATAAWTALLLANDPPILFRTGGSMRWLEHDDRGMPISQEVKETRMRYRLGRVASFYRRQTIEGEEFQVPALPPLHVVQDVLATPDPPLPILGRILGAPVFGADGTLRTEPGYHPASQTYYEPTPGLTIGAVPERPTDAEIEAARDLLVVDLLGDFPFAGEAELAHAVAFLLLPFAREMIRGATPLHLIEKPLPGSGASLLADMLSLPTIGGNTPILNEGENEEEWRKRITAALRESPAVLLIDNINRRLSATALVSAITATVWKDRLLGSSDMIRVPVHCGWLATGNNPVLSHEVARRTVRIRLDPRRDQPWLREGFRHDDLPAWATENRGRLIRAALVLIQGWISKGRPEHVKPRLGGFERWSAIIGGILQVAGVPGFLTNLKDLYELSDSEGEMWRTFVGVWWDRFEEKDVGVSDLWAAATEPEPILDLGGGTEKSQKTKLGKALAKIRDRQYRITTGTDEAELRIVAGKRQQRAQQWKLAKVIRRPDGSEVNVGERGDLFSELTRRDAENAVASISAPPVSSAEETSPMFTCSPDDDEDAPHPADDWDGVEPSAAPDDEAPPRWYQ